MNYPPLRVPRRKLRESAEAMALARARQPERVTKVKRQEQVTV
jgi:hypothetical protein